MSGTSLGHVPAGDRWEFDGDVTAVFEDMLERSIPGYRDMRATVREVTSTLVGDGDGLVIDVGCSDGLALEELLDALPGVRGAGLEISEPMIDAARARLGRFGERAEVVRHDLRAPLPFRDGSVAAVVAVLAVQFTPIEHRQRIISGAHRVLRPGGVFVLVEKVLGGCAAADDMLVSTYYDRKRRAGYTEDEIQRKRLALEGVLVPVTAAWNEAMLDAAGFVWRECVWRSLNFAGWAAQKAAP